MEYLCSPMLGKYRYLAVLVSCFVLFSCNSYEKLLKSSDYDLKLSKAKEYYQKEDYYRAKPLFEELITVYKGTKSVEQIYYFYAYCEYGMGNYLLASYHFKNIYQTYPKSQYAEDCRYRYAYCFYMMSPIFSLDQDNTVKAINAFQLFINSNPTSEKVEEANKVMDKLRRKLELKAFANANLYFNVRDYKAAAISFKNLLEEYPDSEDTEEAQFLIFKSYFLLAKKSIESKKAERYQLTLNVYQDFIDKYPESEHLKEAKSIYYDTLQSLNKIKENGSN